MSAAKWMLLAGGVFQLILGFLEFSSYSHWDHHSVLFMVFLAASMIMFHAEWLKKQ